MARLPPALGWYRRTTYDEPAAHALNVLPGELYHRDGFRSAYYRARRQRRGWGDVLWLRGQPIPCSTYRGYFMRPRRAS